MAHSFVMLNAMGYRLCAFKTDPIVCDGLSDIPITLPSLDVTHGEERIFAAFRAFLKCLSCRFNLTSPAGGFPVGAVTTHDTTPGCNGEKRFMKTF